MFTFICITYNQQQYILEHLESVKFQVETFGKLIDVDFIIIDDCSIDANQVIIDCWLKENQSIFRDIKFIKNKVNMGINQSLVKALRNIKEGHFYILAGDDLYYKNNVFELVHLDYDFINSKTIMMNNNKFYLEKIHLKAKSINSIKKFITKGNVFKAPSIAFSIELLDTDYYKYILNYRNYEDYPTWIYFFILNDKVNKYVILDKPLVIYREGVGIGQKDSTSKGHRIFLKDKKSFYKKYKNVLNKEKPQYYNYYRLLLLRNYIYRYRKLKKRVFHNLYFLFKNMKQIEEFKKHHNNIRQKVNKYKLEHYNAE